MYELVHKLWYKRKKVIDQGKFFGHSVKNKMKSFFATLCVGLIA